MQLQRQKIEKALAKKGFVRKNSHHRYFHLVVEGKDTGIFTYTSHGTAYQTYKESLLRSMKVQLKLASLGQLKDLIDCPISSGQYVELLARKGVLTKRRKK